MPCEKCCKDCECKCLEIHLAWGRDVRDIKIKSTKEYEVPGEAFLSSTLAGNNLAEYLYDNCNYRFVKGVTDRLAALDKK